MRCVVLQSACQLYHASTICITPITWLHAGRRQIVPCMAAICLPFAQAVGDMSSSNCLRTHYFQESQVWSLIRVPGGATVPEYDDHQDLCECYRMEPLAVVGGEQRRPVFADYHRGGRRIHIGLQVLWPPSVLATSFLVNFYASRCNQFSVWFRVSL